MRWITGCWLVWGVACSTKKATSDPSEGVSVEPTTEKSDAAEGKVHCPEGGQTPCTVSSMTPQEIANTNEANLQCVAACVESRRVEAISADVIQRQCQQSCDGKHLAGQPHLLLSPQESDAAPEAKPSVE